MATCVSRWEPNWILLPALERTSVAPELSSPFQIGIKFVESVNLPDNAHGYQISISLYDAVYRCFFGRLWQGPVATCPQGKAASANISYPQTLYMHTSIKSNNVFAVVELLVHTKDTTGQNKCRSFGWGIMRLFKQDSTLPDSSRSSQLPLKKLQFYKGTPRALYLMDEPVENCEHLRMIPGCVLSFTLCTHHALFKVIHLLPENVFFSRSDEVPGLLSSGDAFRKPKLSPTISCQLHNIMLSVPPNVTKFEEELCQLLNEDHYNSSKQTTGTVTNQCINIAERRLKISIHNGWSYIGKQHTVHLDLDYGNSSNSVSRIPSSPSVRRRVMHRRTLSGSSNSSCSATGLLLNSPCLLENLIDSPQCSVVFSLEYVVTEPLMEEHMKLVHSMPRALNRVLLIRWCVWKPFDLTSSGQEMVGNLLTVPLFAGPCLNPDEVFVYKGPSTEMHDEHLARLAPGMIQFRVLLQEKGYDSSAGEDLTMKTENLTRQNVTGKPPLPSQSPRLQTNKNHLLQQIPPQQHQQLHSVPQQGVHIMAGYTAAAAYPSTSPVMNMHQQPSFNVTPFTGVSQHQVTASKYPVAAVGQLAEQMGALTTTDLTELQYTPSHASVVVHVPQTDSTRSLSRASYTRLYNAGFTSLLDRNGDPPEVIDPEKEVRMLHLSKQIQDPLSCNEIVFQFLAFSKLLDYSSTDVGKGPSTMFFTFQFYKYPPLTTERLLLCKNSDKYKRKDQPALYILNKINKGGTPLKTSPGYELRYFIDPCFLKPGEPLLFLQHLQQQTLHIDVWDGDSLLLIGSCSVPLKYACRNGHEAVQCTVELDVLNTEYDEDIDEISDDLGKLRGIQPYGVAAICKGQLHFRIANIGHPPTNPSESDPVMTDLPVKSHVIFSHLCGESEFQGGSLVSGKKKVDRIKKRVARAGHLLNTHPELRTVIASPKTCVSSTMPSPRNGTKDENTDERKRKLARMEIVRDMLGADKKAATVVSYKQELSQRARDLKILNLYRQQTKRDNIMNMLNSVISKEHILYPCFGVSDFFEFVLKNPNNTQETVSIVFEDPELSVITNTQEWKHFKQIYNVATPFEEDMFAAPSADSKFPEIFMRPKEMIYVPFKLFSLSSNHSQQPQGPVDPFMKKKNPKVYSDFSTENEHQSRTIKVYFKTTTDEEILSILSLRLEYQPHVIDQTFRFHHPEQSFLKKSIRLPPLHSLPGVPVGGSGGQRQVFVRCSDSNVICDSQSKESGEPLDIFLKVSVGCSPQVKKFFVAIFLDPFLSRPVQVWQIFVHALQRIDISCVEGQTSRFSLILRGTHSSRLARCFTSHPNDMNLHPSEAFTLVAGSVHELNVAIRPSQVGCKCFYINMVDIEYHQLLRSWLIFTKCEAPAITRTFELILPVGGGRGCNKRVSYTNPYSKRKKFLLHTNRDDLLQFKETQLDIAGGDSQNIGLRFAPVLHPGSLELLVFINDEEDKNEETFCIKATYSDQIAN